MATSGSFDPTTSPTAWFNDSAIIPGWFDKSLIDYTAWSTRPSMGQYTTLGTLSVPAMLYGPLDKSGGTGFSLTIQDGAIGIAGQTLALALSLPLTAGSVTVAGQSIAVALSLPLSAGAVTVAGQSVAYTLGAPIGGGAISVDGQALTLALSGAFALSIDVPGDLSIAGQSITLALSGGTQPDQPTPGFIAAYNDWLQQSQRKRKKRRQAEQQALEQTSADAAAQEIARFLHEQEKLDAQREELARLRALVIAQPLPDELNAKSREAFRLAQEKKTTGAMLALSRAIIRQQEEEHFLITAALMFDE